MENEKMNSIFGGEPSVKDYRTLEMATAPVSQILPISKRIALDFSYVNDLCHQKKLGICTKCGVRMAEELYHKDGVRLSEYWGYLMGKTLIDDVLYGFHFEGSSAFTALKTANKYGTPTKEMEVKYPLNTEGTYADFISHFNRVYGGKIPDAVMENAKLHKIPGYAQVKDITPKNIAKEIVEGRIVVVRLTAGENFYTAPDGRPSWSKKDLLPLRVPKQPFSGHIMAVNEYIDLTPQQLLKGPNSWSKEWADNGYFSFVFNVQFPGYFTEAWVITSPPEEVIKSVKDLPEAKNFKHVFAFNIERGQVGEQVRMLQIALSILGYLNIHVDELGTYGPKTAAAVLAYQRAKKLLPDAQLVQLGGNFVHGLTRSALNSDLIK